MKWTVILFLISSLSQNVRSQDFNPLLNKNESHFSLSVGPKVIVNYLSNEKAVSFAAVGDDYMNKMTRKNKASIFFVTPNKKNKVSPNGSASKIYLKLYGGYGILTPGSFRINTVFFLHDTAVKTQTKKGLGNGPRFGGGIGFIMNDFLNIGVDVEYHKGSWEEDALNAHIDQSNYNIKTSKIDYKTISLTPYVIFKALAKPKYFVYNKLGILLTLPFTMGTTLQSTYANKLNLQNGLNTFTENLKTATSEKYKISLGVGLNVALGVNLKINEKFRIFSEMFGNYSALSPKTSLTIDYNKRFASLSSNSGNSEPLIIKQISNIETHIKYEKGGSLPVNGTYTSALPRVVDDDYIFTDVEINTLAHTFTINMAVLGLNLGIIYRF